MDIIIIFLNGFIEEEVYVEQPPIRGSIDHIHPDYVYKLDKTLYGLKQAPRARYERLRNFLLNKSFTKGKVDTILFTKHIDKDILIVQIYVDDIIFGSTNNGLCKDFKFCLKEFEISMIGELNYFLSLQIKQRKNEIFLDQAKCT